MDYRIFSARTSSFVCVSMHTGVGHTIYTPGPWRYNMFCEKKYPTDRCLYFQSLQLCTKRGGLIEVGVNVHGFLRCKFQRHPFTLRAILIEMDAPHFTRKYTSQVVFEPSTNNMDDKLTLMSIAKSVTLQSSPVFFFVPSRSEGPDEPVPVLSVPGRRDVRHLILSLQHPLPGPLLQTGP